MVRFIIIDELSKIYTGLDLHSNMVRFIIDSASVIVFPLILFTFQYG